MTVLLILEAKFEGDAKLTYYSVFVADFHKILKYLPTEVLVMS